MAQQGPPHGRHSRGPYPGDAAYQDAPYQDASDREVSDRGAAYGDEVPYRDAPYDDQVPLREGAHSGGHEPSTDHGAGLQYEPRSRHGVRPDRGGHPDRSRRADRQRPGAAPWEQIDPFAQGSDTDSELPPWAGPAVYPGRPTGTLRRQAAPRRHDADYREPAEDADLDPPLAATGAVGETRSARRRGRAAATRLRKSRRRVYRWGGIAIVLCVVAAGIVTLVTHHSPQPAPYVTSLQHGEFTSVPSACSSVSTSVLDQYLPGPGRTSTSTQSSSTDSQCSFTIDKKPNFLVLEVEAQSFAPFAAAGANGSATGNARDNFAISQLGLAHPPKKSPLPPAQISNLPGLGQQAIMAFQHAHVTGIDTDIVTVLIRERNAVITVRLSGQESGHGFGPVPVSTLEAGAKAAAQAVLAKQMAQPTV